MNAVVFDGGDAIPGGLVALRGDRARHVLEVLGALPGDSIRAARLGGALHPGARIVRIEGSGPDAAVVVDPGPTAAPPARCPADLALALPRPKCLRRLWPQLAALGPSRVFVTAAEKVEKSYWGCTWLREEERGALLREGLSQACDSVPPQIEIRRRLKPFLEDEIPSLYPEGMRFFAHPSQEAGGGVAAFREACRAPGGPVLVAVGPEGGWSPFECAMFDRLGFRRVSLGPRILRTDTAVVALLSMAALRD